MAVCDLPRRRFRRCPAVTISVDGVRFERTGRSSLTVRRRFTSGGGSGS
ncbi:hypothetical protein OROGR_012155 [Orobanche gracilis]